MQSSMNGGSKQTSSDTTGDGFPCPTRRDGLEALIAQTVTPSMCQSRQRNSYHKCWSCARRDVLESRERVPTLKLTDAQPQRSAEVG